MLLWWRMDFKGVFECLYTAGLVEKNNTAEEKLLCLYRQVFKVVKIAECQVRTCTKKKSWRKFSSTHTWAAKTRRGSICFWITPVLPNIDCHQEFLTSLKFCSKFRRHRHCSSFCWCLIQNSSKAVSVSCNWAKSLKKNTTKQTCKNDGYNLQGTIQSSTLNKKSPQSNTFQKK